MSEGKIKIKGENDGLMLGFPVDMPFSEIMEELGQKLESGAGFFLRGTLVRVPRDRFAKEELAQMQELFRTHGLICRLAKLEPAVPPAPAPGRATGSVLASPSGPPCSGSETPSRAPRSPPG